MPLTNIELQFCQDFLIKLNKNPLTSCFREPVDTQKYPQYLRMIEKPMDLHTVSQKLKNNSYFKIDEWKDDIFLIWKNAQKFNDPNNLVYKISVTLQKKCERAFENIPKSNLDQWIRKMQKIQHKIGEVLTINPTISELVPENSDCFVK